MMTPVPKCLTEKNIQDGIRRLRARFAMIGKRTPGIIRSLCLRDGKYRMWKSGGWRRALRCAVPVRSRALFRATLLFRTLDCGRGTREGSSSSPGGEAGLDKVRMVMEDSAFSDDLYSTQTRLESISSIPQPYARYGSGVISSVLPDPWKRHFNNRYHSRHRYICNAVDCLFMYEGLLLITIIPENTLKYFLSRPFSLQDLIPIRMNFNRNIYVHIR